jgi:chorismate mutase / prephenate dehydratase
MQAHAGGGGKMRTICKVDFQQWLKTKRKRIDRVDQKLLHLLNERGRIALDIGKMKRKSNEKIYRPGRERELLERLAAINKGPLPEENVKEIFKTIVKGCRKIQK